jgi:centromere protein I
MWLVVSGALANGQLNFFFLLTLCDVPVLTRPILASKTPARQRGTSIKPTVDKVCSEAYEHGLLPEPLGRLLDLLTRPNHLDQASLGALARNLYPASAVSPDLVFKVVGGLGHGELKPSLPIQAALLRWLIMVYHVIDPPRALAKAYPVLFNLLDTSAIRSGSTSAMP